MSTMTADLHIMSNLTIQHQTFSGTPDRPEPFHVVKIQSGNNTINLFFHGPAYDDQPHQAFQPTIWAESKEYT